VADYVYRLEKAFRIAFGSDKLGKETMLYGQLQEGLRIGILRCPSVSGAMSYKELCMAAKHEELRQTELKKRQEYSRPHNSYSNKGHNDKSMKDKSHKPSQHSKISTDSNSGQVSASGSSNTARSQQHCYLCNQPGHIAKYCKQSKSKESTGNSSQKNTSVNSQVTTTTPTADNTDVCTFSDP